MSIRRSSLICVAYLQVYERVADNRWWPNIGGLLYICIMLAYSETYGIRGQEHVVHRHFERELEAAY